MTRSVPGIVLALIIGCYARADQCTELLREGLYDIDKEKVDLDAASSFFQWYCDKALDKSTEPRHRHAKIGTPAEVPIEFGWDASSDKWGESYKKFCARVQNDESLRLTHMHQVQTIHDAIHKEFMRCVHAQDLSVWLRTTGRPDTIVFEGRLNSSDPKLRQVTITRFIHSGNVSCENPPTRIGVAGVHTRCHRKGDEAVAMTVGADQDANSGYRVQLPARVNYYVETVYLSDLPTLKEENIHGHLWRDHPYWQPTLVLDRPYDKGLVTHAPLHGVGYVEYDLRGKGYRRFSAVIGIASAENAPLCQNPLVAKPVRFSVFVDGRKAYETPEHAPFGFNSDPLPLDIDIEGASLLKLQVQAVGPTNTCADSAWADAKLTK